MNEIDKAAREYASLNKQYSPVNPTRQTVMDEQIKAFKAGHNHALSMASDDFDKMICSEWQKTLTEHDLLQVKGIWSLAKLSCAKELAEKDKEIERLKGMIMKMADYIHDEDEEGSLCDEAYELINNGGQG